MPLLKLHLYELHNPDDDEFLQIEKVPFKKALEMVLDGSIKDAKTQCAILKANSILNK